MSLCDEYVSALGREIDLPLVLECSQVAFTLDDLTLYLLADDASDTLTGTVAVHELGEDPSPQRQSSLYVRCLKGQYCFGETAGGALSLSSDDRFLLLQHRWHVAALSDRAFIDSFEAFVQTARLWKTLLSEVSEESEPMQAQGKFPYADDGLELLRV